MLNLSRERGESVTITTASGEVVEVHVVKFKGNQVVLGVDAPRSVRVMRSELLQAEKERAQHAAPLHQ